MARSRRYGFDGTRACAASTPQCVLNLSSTTAIRPEIYDLIISSEATPADNAILWTAQRTTAQGTGAGTPTATSLDPGDPAATSVPTKAHTVDPTFTANAFLLRIALNQRATHRWIADPDGGMRLPATANNGIAIVPSHASFTGTVDAVMHFAE